MARLAPLAAALLLLNACSNPLEVGPTLADLPEAQLPSSEQAIEIVDLTRIEQRYQSALEMATDPQVQRHIEIRLADLEMTKSEQSQQQAARLEQFYEEPINRYRALIAANEADPDNAITPAALYYKLAKAYALDGQSLEASATLNELASRYPDSPYVNEAQFRRAERAFAEADYPAAEALYRQVATADSSAFAENALYMQGWAVYKQNRYSEALVIFSQLLDQQLVAAQSPAEVNSLLTALTPTGRNLTEDTLRVMSYSFANLEGAASIAELQQNIGKRPYQHLLYLSLGELYLAQRRYLDSATTYQLFVEHNPNADLAPDFSLREIDVYQRGDFPSRVLPAKQAFVEHYGIYSDFWQARSNIAPASSPLQSRQAARALRAPIMSAEATGHLRTYLDELARHAHARAQNTEGDIARQQGAYREAARWYRERVITFPNHSDAEPTLFLLAEVQEAGGDLTEALDTYEHLAFVLKNPVHGNDAGYSSVLLAERLVDYANKGEPLPGGERIDSALWQWQSRKIDNALQFARLYATDPRAVSVLANAGPELLYQGQLTEAADASRQVLAWQPTPSDNLRYSAWLTLGHASFDLGHYTEAETAYWQALALHGEHASGGGPSSADLRERIAASLYKQAEAELTAGNSAAAIDLWLRIDSELPATAIAAQALFDAAHTAQMQQDWQQAEALFKHFENRYPGHPLTANLPARWVVIYQQQENWAAAAGHLSVMAATSDDPEQARQALLTAAEYYDQAGNWAEARDHYRDYAHTYTEPASDRIEVEHRLAELYREAGDSASRDFWLKRIVSSYQNSPEADERLRYLAASAASELADAPYQQFVATRLTLPLDRSLARKQAALKEAISAQEAVLDYRIADFTTRANYHIGEIYVQLSRDLLASERPDGLSPLELEQYELLLEEEAFPFEERAIDLHEANARRSWQGIYDNWVNASIDSLARLLPARFGKREHTVELADEIY
ncbi:MAG TPA: tetratricopeptide repeat protein [Cellvibrionaceae bacterium]